MAVTSAQGEGMMVPRLGASEGEGRRGQGGYGEAWDGGVAGRERCRDKG
jgi:hypothetical protein